jgi:hypothetical protein
MMMGFKAVLQKSLEGDKNNTQGRAQGKEIGGSALRMPA